MIHPKHCAALLASLALCGALFSCGGRKNQTDALNRLERCSSEDGPLDSYCGRVEVWENRAAQTGRRIALNVVVLPGLRRTSVADPLFFLAGGPGQGAAQLAPQLKEAFRQVLIDRDVVLVDQRGTGKSNSLACKLAEEKEQEADLKATIENLKDCLSGYDADPSLYTTSIAMDDLDEVRAYLGYGKINVYGGSYGARAAIAYARQHPDQLRAVILDGVATPDMSLPLYMARDSQRAFSLLAGDCAADPGCNDRFPDLAGRFERLLDRLDARPEKIRVTNPRTGEGREVRVNRPMVASIVFSALYSPETSAVLPFLITQAEAGDFQGLMALGSLNEGALDQISLGMRYSVVCAEDAPRIADGAIERETSGTFMDKTLAELFLAPCKFWPRGQVPADFYEPFSIDAPALILSGEFDPVTPPVWGEEIAMEWPGARHIVVPGAGHGTFNRGCTIQMIRQFLNEASSANLDSSCVEKLHRRPFFLGYSGPRAAGAPTTELRPGQRGTSQ